MMIIEDLLAKRHMTKYRLAMRAGIPHTTLNDIYSGKTKLEKCSAMSFENAQCRIEQQSSPGVRCGKVDDAWRIGFGFIQHCNGSLSKQIQSQQLSGM